MALQLQHDQTLVKSTDLVWQRKRVTERFPMEFSAEIKSFI